MTEFLSISYLVLECTPTQQTTDPLNVKKQLNISHFFRKKQVTYRLNTLNFYIALSSGADDVYAVIILH
jgi:hypothetical protein